MDEILIRNGVKGVSQEEQNMNVDRTIAVNDMYIEAITAKLKLLDQI